jgi:hypothetical protein
MAPECASKKATSSEGRTIQDGLMEPAVGFEPTTDGLQNRCSTTELSWLKQLKIQAIFAVLPTGF